MINYHRNHQQQPNKHCSAQLGNRSNWSLLETGVRIINIAQFSQLPLKSYYEIIYDLDLENEPTTNKKRIFISECIKNYIRENKTALLQICKDWRSSLIILNFELILNTIPIQRKTCFEIQIKLHEVIRIPYLRTQEVSPKSIVQVLNLCFTLFHL